MRILIDLQGAQTGSKTRGIGRYCQSLAKAIINEKSSHDEVFILLNGLFKNTIVDIKEEFSEVLPDHHFVIFNAQGPVNASQLGNSLRTCTAELLRESIINDLNPDIILVSSLFEGWDNNAITSCGKLYSNVKTAVITYDLIPYIFQEQYFSDDRQKQWYQEKISSLMRADILLTISNSTKLDVEKLLPIGKQAVVNISSAADSKFLNILPRFSGDEDIFRRYKLNKTFFLFVGALEKRKNIEGLIQAYSSIREDLRRNCQLVIVCGVDKTQREDFRNLAFSFGLVDDEVIWTGVVSDEDLVSLYSSCYVFVYPSYYEGFGLPILEAMNCGAAVIGSSASSIPEVIGLDAALFDPYSIISMSQLMEKTLVDQMFWLSLKQHSTNQAKKFSWAQCAKNAIAAFEEAVNEAEFDAPTEDDRLNELLNAISLVFADSDISKNDLIELAITIEKNEHESAKVKAFSDYSGEMKWRIEGPYDSSYSLALLNRETALSISKFGHFVVLNSPDYQVDRCFLSANANLDKMAFRDHDFPPNKVDILSRNNYPPFVDDMSSSFNMLHHYAWEESGYPQSWVFSFNRYLNGITCLADHVKKVLIDNGVNLPMLTSGCGVDHWERIIPLQSYKLEAKKFRFLHVSSCFPRKGVELMLDAYGQTFTIYDDVTLIIKTFDNPHNEISTWLSDRKNLNPLYPHVIVMMGDISDAELKALYLQCHVMVAPSRAEGFGLPLAEALLSGLPVITTKWGGQIDFCNVNNSWMVDYNFEPAKTHFGLFSSVWAAADVNKLGNSMREAFLSTSDHLHLKAASGRALLLQSFKWEDVAIRAINAALKWKQLPNRKVDVKLGWFTTWNIKCGIATYSAHLINNLDVDKVMIFSQETTGLVNRCNSDCIRYKSGEMLLLESAIRDNQLNVIVIQFNYGLYDFAELCEFIEKQVDNGLIVAIFMHATGEYISNMRLYSALVRCHRIFVHTVSDLNRLKEMGLIENVVLLPHGVMKYSSSLSLSDEFVTVVDEPIIATYGFCLPHKGLMQLVDAIALLKEKGCFVRLRMVNAAYPSSVSIELVETLKNQIEILGLSERVEFYSEFLEDDQSLRLLKDATLIVFPYQQTAESASGAVRYGIASMRPVAVTSLPIFDDMGDAVLRFTGIDAESIAEDIIKFLNELSNNSGRAENLSLVAQAWREQHDYAIIGKRLSNIFCSLVRENYYPKYFFNGSSPAICSHVGLVSGKYMVTTSHEGFLIYGPYISLKPGRYIICIHGETSHWDGREWFDIVYDSGKNEVCRTNFSQACCGVWRVEQEICLMHSCNDFELRIWVYQESMLSIKSFSVSMM